MIDETVYIAARVILTQIANIKEYLRELEQTAIAEEITMPELFARFDDLLDDEDRQFFALLQAYYIKEYHRGN